MDNLHTVDPEDVHYVDFVQCGRDMARDLKQKHVSVSSTLPRGVNVSSIHLREMFADNIRTVDPEDVQNIDFVQYGQDMARDLMQKHVIYCIC